MTWALAVLVVLLMGGVALVASGRGEGMAEEPGDRRDVLVPGDRPLAGEDLRRVRFSLGFRGYRMAEVDALLDRLAGELDEARAAREPGAPGPGESGTGSDDATRPEADERDDAPPV